MKITVEAVVPVGVKTVWDYHTDPEHITKWNFASEDWCCPRAGNDLRVGGKYSARMEAKDGSAGFDFEATYDEIVNLETFAYTMTDGRRVITAFEQVDGGTKVKITFDAEKERFEEMQRNGWQAILNNFKKYVVSNIQNRGSES